MLDRPPVAVDVEVKRFEGDSRAGLTAQLASDHLRESNLARDENVYRVAVRAPASEPASVILALGGIPQHGVARADAEVTHGASAFRIDTRRFAPEARSGD